jgi:hypothetical protein
LETLEEFVSKESIESRREKHLATQSSEMRVADQEDKETAREKRKEKRMLQKLKEKAAKEGVGVLFYCNAVTASN